MMLRANKLSDFLCFLMLAWFLAILIYKIQAAPFPIFLYLRETFFLTLVVFIAGFVPFSFMHAVLRKGVCAAVTAVNLLLLINQLLHPLLDLLKLQSHSVYFMEAIVFFGVLLGSHFLWKWLIRVSTMEASSATVLQAGLSATTLALLLKLESYPDAAPYLAPAQPLTLWAPVAFAGVAIFLNICLYICRMK